MTHLVGDKTHLCLLIASLPVTSEERSARQAEAISLFGEWGYERKMGWLADRGYIDFGVNPIYGWLTEKGEVALKEAHNTGIEPK